MANSFADLLKNRQNQRHAVKAMMDGYKSGFKDREPDARFWTHKHIVNETTKKGHAKIRFLPAPIGEDIPFVRIQGYFAQSPVNRNFYYVHNSLRNFDTKAEDPAYEYNGKIYSQYGKEGAKGKTIKIQKKFVSNILVIDDPVRPENNGKVFLYEYGPMIYEKLEKIATEDDDFGLNGGEPVDPFDPIGGAVFHLRITPKKLGNDVITTYEESVFLSPSPLADTEAEMEAIWKRCYSLKEFRDPNNHELFKPIEQQRADFARWLGEGVSPVEEPSSAPRHQSATEEPKGKQTEEEKLPWEDDGDDETSGDSDQSLDDFFASLK